MGKEPLAGRNSTDHDLSHIAEGLRSLAVPVDDLVHDPANARTHNERNLNAICGSLRQFGQRKPLVVQQQGMIVRAGNGTLEAARKLGWSHIAALLVDEDNVAAISFAIADNRTAELAEWDDDVLVRMLHEVEVGDEELQQMFAELAEDLSLIDADSRVNEEAESAEHKTTTSAESTRDTYAILIKCQTEDQQVTLLNDLTAQGYECRALVG